MAPSSSEDCYAALTLALIHRHPHLQSFRLSPQHRMISLSLPQTQSGESFHWMKCDSLSFFSTYKRSFLEERSFSDSNNGRNGATFDMQSLSLLLCGPGLLTAFLAKGSTVVPHSIDELDAVV